MHTIRLFTLALALLFVACEAAPEAAATDNAPQTGKSIIVANKVMPAGNEPNPHAEGFNLKGSDNLALGIADSIVKYHGGRKAWDDTRFLEWNFFGARSLTWDKDKSRVRIDQPSKNMVYLLDYSDEKLTGRVRKLGDEITNTDSLSMYLNQANSMFNNDAFWLVHQFKLKDNGVTLKYGGEARTDPQAQRPSFIIDQTFAGVGNTPDNRYRLFVDKVTYRINTWQFFPRAEDTEPAIETPWSGYLPYGDIMLSGDRGGRFQLTGISAKKQMSERVFTEF